MTSAACIVALFVRLARRLTWRWPVPSESSVFLLGDNILTFESGADEIVLFDTDTRNAYLLNHTAAAAIRLTDGARTLGWIARNLAWAFDEEAHVVGRDIRKTYRELLTKGVVRMTPDRSLIPRMKRESVIRQEDDGAFIFDPVTDRLSAVNETGLLVLRQIDGKRTVAGVIRAVASHFSDVEPKQLEHDVKSFIDDLVNRGFIETRQ